MKRLIKGQLVIWVYKENILGIMLSAFLFGGVVACSDEQATEKQLTDESGLPEYPIPDRTTIVAFPGAYGAGKYTTGGAGGTVYIVTSLADDGVVGTLRHAIQQKEIASANANNTSSTAFKVKNDERTSSDLLLDMRIDILSDYSFMQSATDAYETVLAYAGAWTCGWKDNKYIIPERDKIDRRIVSETANGTYSTNASKGGGYGLIDSQEDTIEKWDEYITETSSLVDTDKDGIPDGWEIAKGLNPNDASDGAKYNLSAAYTNLEVYLNGLVENTFPASHSK